MADVELTFNRAEFRAFAQRNATRAVFAATEHVKGALAETLSGNRSGRTYRVPGTGVTYTASAPGEAPAVRLGDLRRSEEGTISATSSEDMGLESMLTTEGVRVVGTVGTRLDYGLYLERGTINMEPRPWLAPTFSREESTIRQIVSEDWS